MTVIYTPERTHLYTGTNARAQDLRHHNPRAHPGSTDAGCILLVHRGVRSHQDTANLIWHPWRWPDARIEELGPGIADGLGPRIRLTCMVISYLRRGVRTAHGWTFCASACQQSADSSSGGCK